jgi:ABC-type Fe3+-citrate transport system substrate-binding protein
MFTKSKALFLIMIIFLVGSLVLVGCSSNSSSNEVNSESADSEVNNESSDSEVKNETSDNESATNSNVRVIEHEVGNTEIEGTPERIVVLEFSFADALVALDLSPVGIADEGDVNRMIEEVHLSIGDYTSVGTRKQPSLEVISSLNPDLIIGDLKRHKDIYEDLKQIAPTIILDSLSADYEGIIDGFSVIAKAVNKEEEAQIILNEHAQAIITLKEQIPSDEARTVMPAVITDSGFHAHSSVSYTGSLLESIGIKNAVGLDANLEQVNQYNKLNLEQIVEFNPDILFLISSGEKTIVDEWKDNKLWNEISAVKNDQVYYVDRATWAWNRGLISSEAIVKDTIKHLYGN